MNDLPRTVALVDTQFLAVPLALNETSIRSGHFRLSHIPVLMKIVKSAEGILGDGYELSHRLSEDSEVSRTPNFLLKGLRK